MHTNKKDGLEYGLTIEAPREPLKIQAYSNPLTGTISTFSLPIRRPRFPANSRDSGFFVAH